MPPKRTANLVKYGMEDLEDICVAEATLADPLPALPLEQVRKQLGLDD